MGDVFLQGYVMENNTREQGFSPQGDFAPRRHLSLSGDVFVYHNWGLRLLLDFPSRGQGCSNPPTMHRTGPHDKESPDPHANSPEAEKLCRKDALTFLMYVFFLHLSLVPVFFIPPNPTPCPLSYRSYYSFPLLPLSLCSFYLLSSYCLLDDPPKFPVLEKYSWICFSNSVTNSPCAFGLAMLTLWASASSLHKGTGLNGLQGSNLWLTVVMTIQMPHTLTRKSWCERAPLLKYTGFISKLWEKKNMFTRAWEFMEIQSCKGN